MTFEQFGHHQDTEANSSAIITDCEKYIEHYIQQMSLKMKIGQLTLVNSWGGEYDAELRRGIAEGSIGAVLNEINPQTVEELQKIAREQSPLGIPLLIGRDVIHGFKTVFPIPLGMAASWDEELVNKCSRLSAIEATAHGINWTFAPMLDIGRDPRWGRVAETFGEDPYLISRLGAASIKGFQGEDLSAPGSVAACAKHFAGYGACESGKDYNTTNIPEAELRNVHLPPFAEAVKAGVASFMTSFSDLNGIPASGNEFLLKQVLRQEWKFDGFVVSDWESIKQLSIHGVTEDDKDSALMAASAGLDMEMASNTYQKFIEQLTEEGLLSVETIDEMVRNILRIKFRLGLLHNTLPRDVVHYKSEDHLNYAYEAAVKSLVLLRNKHNILPLNQEKTLSLTVIGPMADDGYEQLGTWIFDGDASLSVTPLQSLKQALENSCAINYFRGMETTRSKSIIDADAILTSALESDAVILFLGEESFLSGEAHCRSDISLPGVQEELITIAHASGKPVIVVILAGRALALQNIVEKTDALLFAWHPGTMSGPAIADILLGNKYPSGKLPVTFPRVTGQVPIYYAARNTGKPVTPETYCHIDSIPARAGQVSLGNTSFHIDVHYTPLFPFGFGLGYTEFEYSNIRLSSDSMTDTGYIDASVEVKNIGESVGTEIVQLYIRDKVASLTRPLRELKGYSQVTLSPGETTLVTFKITSEQLSFYNRKMISACEPGAFRVFIGGDSTTELSADFSVTNSSAL